MKKPGLGIGALVGGLLTAPVIGLLYLADQLAGLQFVPFDLFNWIARVMPGPLITFGIDLMIDSMLILGISVADTAKIAEQVMAVLLFFALGVIFSLVCFAVLNARKTSPNRVDGLVMGTVFGLPIAVISVGIGEPEVDPVFNLLWLAVLFMGWGLILRWAYGRLSPSEPEPSVLESEKPALERVSRREFLITLGGGAAAITVVGSGLGALLARSETRDEEVALDETADHQVETPSESPFPNAEDPVVPAPGTRPEYTPLKDHYKVFIELEPTVIDGATWTLPIMGLVDNPLMLTLPDLRENYQPRDQYVTMSCISGRVGTTLIGTTLWTGASLREILADAQVRSDARYIHIMSGDGFYETVDLDLINADERIMLCYDWDGNPLPVDHGFPLRIWLPDRYGMKQPRWITRIEVTDENREGYWVERGWDEVAQVKTTSVIDTVAVDATYESGDQTLIPIGGIAFSGDRGISKVEIRVDEGPWQEAQLRTPLSETTWVFWRFEWPFAPGSHLFEVRCVEGDGTPQIEETRKNRPSGATGIHNKQVNS